MAPSKVLKRSSLGDLRHETRDGLELAVRDFSRARFGCRWLARRLAAREARALSRLDGLAGIPALVALDRSNLRRSFLPGLAMHHAEPASAEYFRSALRLLRLVHSHNVAHNDLAKEANWLATSSGAAIVDFQLAVTSDRRGPLFRAMAREDLRHLFKHKRHYLPEALTARQRRWLEQPLWPARAWRALAKPVYRLVTRRVLGWQERDGAEERQRPS